MKKDGNEESKTRKNEKRREKMEERERERDMCVNECVRRTDRQRLIRWRTRAFKSC